MTYQCSVCRGKFEAPPSAKRVTCSQRCRSVWMGQKMTGVTPTWATAGRLQAVHEASRAEVLKRFGELSVLELEIIKHFYWRSYNRGYQRALHRQRRVQERAA